MLLVASAALASGRATPSVRTLLLPERPDRSTHRVHVRGQVVTTLRFERPVDADRTKMIGWEGRLEPLSVVRNKVLLEPLHDLDDDEGIPLAVTLVDGTELAFLLRPPPLGERADQQINVFEDPETYGAMHGVLLRTLEENGVLTEEVARHRKEEGSEDHALATLLATGAVTQTPFKLHGYVTGKDDETDIKATVYRGKGKAAVVFNIRNLALGQPWRLKSAQALTVASGRAHEVAVRSTRPSIEVGESGVVAVVVNRRAFVEDGKLTGVFLEISRHDGLRQSFVELDPSLLGD